MDTCSYCGATAYPDVVARRECCMDAAVARLRKEEDEKMPPASAYRALIAERDALRAACAYAWAHPSHPSVMGILRAALDMADA